MSAPATTQLPPLLPAVQSFRALGDANGRTVAIPPAALAWRRTSPLDMSLPPPPFYREELVPGWCGAEAIEAQSYTLRIDQDERNELTVHVSARTTAACRYARATFAQLLDACPTALPRAIINDAPAFARRGVMLDVSRCRIPTMAEFHQIIDRLAMLKCNHLQLYTEHTFAYSQHEPVWRGWSPLTAAEIIRLDAFCESRGIELIANQNCFGHLKNWLEHPDYRHLAETHGDWMFDVWPRSGPFSLCPTDPASLRFVEGLLSELLPNFRAPWVNIGCDETYDIAYGRSKDAVADRGRGVVFAEFVSKIADAARTNGARTMLWGDIALSHPECLSLLPSDSALLAWSYEPDAAFGKWCRTIHDSGREAWVCPGTSSWCSITGRTTERTANIQLAAAEGIANNAEGFLICDWGDSGHWQQWPIAMLGIAHGLHAAWSGITPFDARAASLHAIGDTTQSAGPWLEQLGNADEHLRACCLGLSRPGMSGRLRNQTALFADLKLSFLDRADVGTAHEWRTAHESLLALAASRPRTSSTLLNDELAHTANLSVLASARGLRRRGGLSHSGWSQENARAWHAAKSEHTRLWHIRSRSGGLAQSTAFFDPVIASVEAMP